MSRMTLFERIFSDAHVVDIDLAAWDKHITLYVVADHAGRTADGHLPLFMIEFRAVQQWNLTFNHHASSPPLERGPHEHVQWHIHEWRLRSVERGLEVTLLGPGPSPTLSLVCDKTYISELPHHTG